MKLEKSEKRVTEDRRDVSGSAGCLKVAEALQLLKLF